MNRKPATYLCFAILITFAMALTIMSPLLTYISETLSLNMVQAGFLFTSNFIGFVSFIMIGGILADRWGKKRVLSASIAGFAVSMLVFPLSPNFAIACIITVFMGGFGGIVESIANALISDLNPENSSFYVNLSQVFFGMGAVAGPIAAGYIVALGGGWQVCYLGLGVLGLVLSVLLTMAKFPMLPPSVPMTWKSFKGLITNGKFLLICLCMIFYTGSEVGGWGWLSTYVKQDMGFDAAKSGAAVGLFWIAMTVGRLLCSPLVLKYKIRHLIMGLAGASAVVTILSGFARSEAVVWVIIAAVGLTYSSQWPLIAAYGAEQTDVSTGTVFALLVGSGGVGAMIVPYGMGLISDAAGMRTAMVSPAILLLGIVVILCFIGRKRAVRSAEPSMISK